MRQIVRWSVISVVALFSFPLILAAVTVTGSLATVQTQVSGVSTVITSQSVDNLPVARRPFDLLALTPGVGITGTTTVSGFNEVNVAAGSQQGTWFAGKGNGKIGFRGIDGMQSDFQLPNALEDIRTLARTIHESFCCGGRYETVCFVKRRFRSST